MSLRGKIPSLWRALVGLAGSSLLLAVLITVTTPTQGEDRPVPVVIQGAKVIATATAESITTKLTELPAVMPWAQGDPVKETNVRNHHGRKPKAPQLEPRRDALLGFQARVMAAALLPAFDKADQNEDGQVFSGVNPPDTSGDVSDKHYIQAINSNKGTLYAVYDKKDLKKTIAGPFRLSDLGGKGGCKNGLGDPIVLWDHLAKRWVLAEFARDPNTLCVYVSKTEDPINGGWHHYPFVTAQFPDYPHYGVWPDAYYVTSNEDTGPAVYAMDREKMLAGAKATIQRFETSQLEGFGFQALTPSDVEGPAPPRGSPNYLLRHRDDEVHNVGSNDKNQDFLELFEFHVDWANPANSNLSGPVAIGLSDFNSDLNGLTSFACFPQKGSSIRLDPLREVIMNRMQYRNFGTHETLVGSFVTDVDGTDHGGVRWFELRKGPKESWRVQQEGTYAPDSHHRWMSSIAMDSKGNIALGFNMCSDTMFPSLRVVGRFASDPMGTMPRGELSIAEGTAANGNNRYGDYAALSVDDDDRFWFTGQYNKAANWSTRIASFKFR